MGILVERLVFPQLSLCVACHCESNTLLMLLPMCMFSLSTCLATTPVFAMYLQSSSFFLSLPLVTENATAIADAVVAGRGMTQADPIVAVIGIVTGTVAVTVIAMTIGAATGMMIGAGVEIGTGTETTENVVVQIAIALGTGTTTKPKKSRVIGFLKKKRFLRSCVISFVLVECAGCLLTK